MIEEEKDDTATGVEDTAPQDNEEGASVPYARFAEVVAERNALRSSHEAAKAASVELRAGYDTQISDLRSQLEAAKGAGTERDREVETLRQDLRLSREHGVNDPEIAEFVRYRYNQTKPNEAGERPAFDDWLADYKATDPPVLRNARAVAPKAKPPKINGTASDVGASDRALDPADMTMEQYKAHRAEVLKAEKIKVNKGAY